MAQTYPDRQETPRVRKRQAQPERREQGDGMEMMAEEVKRHYLSPLPSATDPTPDPFPPAVMRGLGLGSVVGALLGLLAAWLLWNGTIVIPGWEGMFSMGDFTFFFFWTMLGIAFGGAVIGIGAILAARQEPADAHAARQTERKDTKQHR